MLPNFWDFAVFMPIPFNAERPRLARQHVERGVFLGFDHASHPKGQGPSTSQFWGSLLFMHTPFDAERPNLTW